MDDEIIHSWCFHDVECFDSTPSAAIIILDKDLESFSSLRSQQTPYEMWSGKKPKLSHLRIFGSIVHVKTPGALGKLEDRSKEMVFVGYERGTKGYRCFNPTTHKVYLSRDVIFDEGRKWNFME